MSLIGEIKENDRFPTLKFYKESYIPAIGHTLDKEVDILVSYIKHSASNKRKQEALDDAQCYG